jgi:hypothetical protein
MVESRTIRLRPIWIDVFAAMGVTVAVIRAWRYMLMQRVSWYLKEAQGRLVGI